MRNVAKALAAIVAIAGIAIATCEGIEVLTLDEGIEVLSCSSEGIEVLAADGIEVLGAYFVATMNGVVVDMCPIDPITRTGTVQFPVMQAGNHIGILSPTVSAIAGYDGSTILD